MREFPEAIDLARRIGEPSLLVQAYHFAGVSTFHLGAFQTAHDWLRQSLEAGESQDRYHSEVYGINMGVFCRAYIGHCYWHLGYLDRALKTAEEALSLAREVSHPFSIALALAYLAMLRQFRREPEAALKTAEEAGGLCHQYRFDYYGAWSALLRAWAIAVQGQIAEGISAYDAALKEFEDTGAGENWHAVIGGIVTTRYHARIPFIRKADLRMTKAYVLETARLRSSRHPCRPITLSFRLQAHRCGNRILVKSSVRTWQTVIFRAINFYTYCFCGHPLVLAQSRHSGAAAHVRYGGKRTSHGIAP